MFDYILAGPNLPFAVALAILLIIAILEGVGAVFGAAFSEMVESFIPDLDVPEVNGPDIDNPSALVRILSWIRVGEIPLMILMIVFLMGFALSGLFMQSILQNTIGYMLPSYIAVIPAALIAIPFTRMFGGVLAKIMPRDETQAISQDAFIGRIAVISLGTARHQSPAQGKLIDEFGTSHYIMIEPDLDNDHFEQGEEVLIVRKAGSVFTAIKNDHQAMQ